ncbi:MAG TPA: hypothetical protein QGH10_10690 [Armatimonadota bacterium]|nr:hypothetical protein [Armatimonadota bacterium]
MGSDAPVETPKGQLKGLCCGVVGLLVLAVALGIGPPFLALSVMGYQKGHKAPVERCRSNLRQLTVAMDMYVDDCDDVYPPHARWPVRLEPYTRVTELYECPSVRWPPRRVDYAYADFLGGALKADVPDPVETYMFWDADARAEAVFRHHGGLNVAYVDGHVKLRSGTGPWGITLLNMRHEVEATRKARESR